MTSSAFPVAVAAAPAPSEVGLRVSPNPSRGTSTVSFALSEAAEVGLSVYDGLGREVVVDDPMAAGAHTVGLDARGWPSGVYLVRLVAGAHVETGRLAVLR